MARKRDVRDFAITMDEFHPSPSTAAAFADRKANDATMAHLLTDRKRVADKIDVATDEGTLRMLRIERERVDGLIAQTTEDRKQIDTIIQEARVK